MYPGFWLWEARSVVFREGLRLWGARYVVFYEGLRLWEAHLYVFYVEVSGAVILGWSAKEEPSRAWGDLSWDHMRI